MPVIVSGKDTVPYIVPSEIEINCVANHKNCFACPLYDGDKVEVKVKKKIDMNNILSLLDCNADQQQIEIRKIFNIRNCKNFTMKS
jgi:hypothetical protein